MNSAVSTWLFPKAAGRNTPPRDHCCQWLPFTAYGTFSSGTVELYQSNYGTSRNHEAAGFVNSTVSLRNHVHLSDLSSNVFSSLFFHSSD